MEFYENIFMFQNLNWFCCQCLKNGDSNLFIVNLRTAWSIVIALALCFEVPEIRINKSFKFAFMKYFIPQSGNIGDDINSLRDTYKCLTNVGSFKNVNHEMNSERYRPIYRIFALCVGKCWFSYFVSVKQIKYGTPQY